MREREEYTRGPLRVRVVEKPHCLGGKHLQYYIETVADHPQLKAPNQVLGIAQGLPAKEGDPVVPVLWLRKPDAELFAAAPDLLEAAKAAKEFLMPDLVEPGRTVFWALVAAIKKAEPQS